MRSVCDPASGLIGRLFSSPLFDALTLSIEG